MKTKFQVSMLIVAMTFVSIACKKGSGDSNPYNDIVETKAPIQKPVSVNVNANIGGYQEALPALYDSTSKKYPLLLFVHGVGELGNGTSELGSVTNVGTPKLIKNGSFPAAFTSNGKTFSFIVISPQFKAWPSPADVDAIINYSKNKYRIDTNMIYVSGLSMGGGITWDYAATYNTKIAAIAPICGASGPNDQKAQKLATGGVKVWAFHNQDDGIVNVNNSIVYVNKINSYTPPVAAKLTVWPSGGHDAWTKATDPNYKEGGLNMYEWMLQYERGK